MGISGQCLRQDGIMNTYAASDELASRILCTRRKPSRVRGFLS